MTFFLLLSLVELYDLRNVLCFSSVRATLAHKRLPTHEVMIFLVITDFNMPTKERKLPPKWTLSLPQNAAPKKKEKEKKKKKQKRIFAYFLLLNIGYIKMNVKKFWCVHHFGFNEQNKNNFRFFFLHKKIKKEIK